MIRKKISTMKNRYYIKLFAILVVFMAVCLIPATLFAQEGQGQGETAESEDGRKMSREAQEALVESQRRFETNPDDLAAARQPIIDFLKTPVDPIPITIYQMLGQFWYIDEKNDKHTEEAREIYKIGHEAFPEDDGILLNYAVTTYELANTRLDQDRTKDANQYFVAAAQLFEKYYEVNEAHDIKYLEYAAAAYYTAENLGEAKRLYVRMIGLVELPEARWLDSLIYICQGQEDSKGAEKYIRLALSHYPMEKKYWRLLANTYIEKEKFADAAAAFEVASRVELPDQRSEWRALIDLYNYLGLPLRSAEAIQDGLDLLAAESTELEQQLAIAEAYDRGARVDKAVSYLDSLIAKNPSYELKLKKATILYDARRNKEALAALDDCIAMKANAYDAYYMKGWIAWDMEDWKMAKRAFGEASNSRDESIRYTSENAIEMLLSLDEAKSK